MSPLAGREAARRVLAMGNEALARGALEAGVGFASTYPGTPASEVTTALQELQPRFPGLCVEVSTNEHVATLAAMGASWSGVRSLVTMKHVGMNVAAEPLHFAGYTGVKGGMLVVLGSDPGATSSTSEQDDRWYSLHTHLPVLEPSDIQEAKEFARRAFAVSEAYDLPVVVNAPTKLCHNIGGLTLGALPEAPKYRGSFERNPERFLNLFDMAARNHGRALANVERLRGEAGSLGFNQWIRGSGRTGILTSGLHYAYVLEALEVLGLGEIPVLKLGLTYPLDPALVVSFLSAVDRLVVVEELEGFLEFQTKSLAYDSGARTPVVGKDLFPASGELTADQVLEGLSDVFSRPVSPARQRGARVFEAHAAELPPRQGAFCPGCPHRGTAYALLQAAGRDVVYAGDIGCYTLSVLPPFQVSDFVTCMNCGLGTGQGIAQVDDRPVVGLVGDSTFFHSGLPSLLNAVQNRADLLLLILDNRWVAMTGHQPSPTTDLLTDGTRRDAVDVVSLVKTLGVRWVRKGDAFNPVALQNVIREGLKERGVRVIVVEGECALPAERRRRAFPGAFEEYLDLDPERCQRCHRCYRDLACPAIRELDDPEGLAEPLAGSRAPASTNGVEQTSSRTFRQDACGEDRRIQQARRSSGAAQAAPPAGRGGAFVLRYAIDEALCQRCGVCEAVCPNSAIYRTRISHRRLPAGRAA